ncbi:nucleotidyltransferase domain-containing protein [Rhodomicrobium sp. Az07]|uniref:nucleotidyltransferase family protein n=1 Tax=Rhodomicrobium sp. Az07 TaxID=2839034 RepID=UPI001BE8DF64|nr:nucleotidyltransferase domain-containing protein [Rhodomicrobium sp. Az07]MBT3071419.1 nucleotidyltransferase domain-containing protein [Rhodomicrobium sp. Az07]
MTAPTFDHGLSPRQMQILRDVLAPFADSITRVGVFGLRATGTFRPDSDIDMVLHGQITDALVDRLWTLFDASSLPLKVDLVGYDLIAYPPLQEHIDAVEKTLFTREDLTGHPGDTT